MGLTLPADYRDFKGSRKGETAWVIGSGASVDHVAPGFLDDKLCVCVNYVGMKLELPEFYSVTHYWLDAISLAAYRPDLPIITPDQDQGGRNKAPYRPEAPNIYMPPAGQQQYAAFRVEDHWPTEPDQFVVGPTSLHMTMHFAAYLVGPGGHIVLVGADCGTVDGASNFGGYHGGDNPFPVWASALPQVADRIRADGVSVHSLNPWVNFALEGHQYRSPAGSVN